MRLGEVNLHSIGIFLLLFVLLFIDFGGLAVVDGFIDVPLLLFGLVELLQHLGSDAHRQFLEHLLHLLHLIPQGLSLFSQRADQLVSLRFIDHGLVLNLLRLICVSEGRKGLFVVVSGWRNGANHQGFTVASQSVLEDTSQAGVSVRHYDVLSFSCGLIGKSRNDQTQN